MSDKLHHSSILCRSVLLLNTWESSLLFTDEKTLLGVYVTPDEVEIYTARTVLRRSSRLSPNTNPAPIALLKSKLAIGRQAEATKYPVLVRSNWAKLTVEGFEVNFHGDYQMKVG